MTVKQLQLYTKLQQDRDRTNQYNLRIYTRKPDLIKQLVVNGLWNERDTYDYLGGYDIFNKRAKTSTSRRLRVAGKAYIQALSARRALN